MGGFRPQVFDISQAALLQPLRRSLIGCLGIHVNQTAPLLHRNQIEFCLPGWAVKFLAVHLRPLGQQFPAATGILDMDGFNHAVNFHMGNEAIGSVDKNAGLDTGVGHNLSFL